MKSLLFCLLVFVISCEQKEEKTSIASEPVEAESKTDKTTPVYPYTATYSMDFEMGDPMHTQTVLNLWKAYENNKLDSTLLNHFADSIIIETREGETINMSSAQMLQQVVKDRGMLKDMKVTLEGAVPLYSRDKKTSFVLINGNESWTESNGKKDSIMLHDVWGLNEQGKVFFLRSYGRKQQKN